ncbi:restriction endonuclease subunit S [Lysinibacillus fusiformis]|uniref:restriction endonuclease subunit S n=1 Tax=Lysinibacillus fusiformis TaxID=28031 RepID=UPI0030182B07
MWGEYKLCDLFNRIEQGRRLKKEDQLPGEIPFVMAGTTNTGVVNYISNPVARFPKNSITIDIFGNTFYRNYDFGAGDDTGVYWNSEKTYSEATMLFFTIAIAKALAGKFSFGNKLRSSKSFNFKIQLPIKNGQIDFEFMEAFIAELEAESIVELEKECVAELEAYLLATDLDDYELTAEEQQVLDEFVDLKFEENNVIDIFDVKNTQNILSRDIVKNSGETPYLGASSENNAVSSYISYHEKYLDEGNCIFIGGKTFVVTYQEKDFYSNDSHNLILYLKDKEKRTKLNQLYLATCINKSLKHKYSWGNSISNKKIKKDKVFLPIGDLNSNYATMETFISAIQKLVIKDVVLYANRKIDATKSIINKKLSK